MNKARIVINTVHSSVWMLQVNKVFKKVTKMYSSRRKQITGRPTHKSQNYYNSQWSFR